MFQILGTQSFHNGIKWWTKNILYANWKCLKLKRSISTLPGTLYVNNHRGKQINVSPFTTMPNSSGCRHLAGCEYMFIPKRTLSRISRSWFKTGRKLNYDIVDIAEVGPSRLVLNHIPKPDYAVSGVAEETPSDIEKKNADQIKKMRECCAMAKTILDEVANHIKVGRTTDELDSIVHAMCNSFGAYPSPLNYRGFPKSVCTSVNNVACHGIPDSRQLKDGDIISVDVSVFYNGYHGDCAATYGVGNVDRKGQYLMDVAYQCLEEAIHICFPGQALCEIGKTVSAVAKKNGFNVVPAFCGHGIGSYFHGAPSVLHYENEDKRPMLEGMTFTIEPVITEGEPDIVVLEDGWTATTEDNSRCAQYEHTLLITSNGAEILTVANVDGAIRK